VSSPPNNTPPFFEKEGLQTAVDFTKTLLTLSGGAIAFILQPIFYGDSPVLRGMAVLALLALAICVLSGLFVISRCAVLLAHKNYNIEDPHVKVPGLINIWSFAAGFLFISILVAGKILGGVWEPPSGPGLLH
jgi:hypothetical protein